jgi:hypothetical protein
MDAGFEAGRADIEDVSLPPDSPPACEKALIGDVLDPGEVYLAGTVEEGACYKGAIAHWSCPNVGAVGFDCYFDGNSSVNWSNSPRLNAYVRPTDGRLIYTNLTTETFVREFHCDDCPFDSPSKRYSRTPLDNDPFLPKDCDLGNPFPEFFVSPTGMVLYYCPASKTWRDNGGLHTYVESNDPLLHVGYGNLGLTATRIVDLESGKAIPIVGFAGALSAVAIRAVPPDKFWVVEPRDSLGQSVELWEIDGTGMSRRVLQYASAPANLTLRQRGRLDKSGAFSQMGSTRVALEDIIVRRDMQGGSEVVYTETTNPLVKIHISGLITGP